MLRPSYARARVAWQRGPANIGSETVPTTRLIVRVQPRASVNAISRFAEDGVLRVRVTEPPVDGRANRAVERLLAKALDVPRSRVTVVRGATARTKTVEIEGLAEQQVRERLAPAAG